MKLQDVIGYDLHQVMVPSIMEPVDAVKQYINFFNLNEDSVVLDLGSYSGLTAILFDKEIVKVLSDEKMGVVEGYNGQFSIFVARKNY